MTTFLRGVAFAVNKPGDLDKVLGTAPSGDRDYDGDHPTGHDVPVEFDDDDWWDS